MDPRAEPLHVTHVDCQETDESITLTLAEGAGGAGRSLRFVYWYDAGAHEVVSGDSPAAYEAVNSWALIGRALRLEYDPRSADKLGLPRLHQLRLDVADDQLAEVRDSLVEILVSACHLIG